MIKLLIIMLFVVNKKERETISAQKTTKQTMNLHNDSKIKIVPNIKT